MGKKLGDYYYSLLFIGVYLAWKVLDSHVLSSALIRPHYQEILEVLAHFYQLSIGFLLEISGYKVVYAGKDTVMLTEHSGLRIMERCLAVSASFVFFFTVIFYRKKRLVNRLAFGVAGVAIIFFINILRLATYAVMHYKCPKIISIFFHDYGYVVITYGLILVLLIWWIEKTPDKNVLAKENTL